MIKVYKYLNGHSPGIMNDILKLRESMCNLRNVYIFQAAKPRLLKYGLDGIPFYIREATSLALFKNRIKL